MVRDEVCMYVCMYVYSMYKRKEIYTNMAANHYWYLI